MIRRGGRPPCPIPHPPGSLTRMSIWTRRSAALAAAVAVLAAAGCTTALRADPDSTALPIDAARSEPAAPPAEASSAALADLDGVEPVLLDAPEFGREPPVVPGPAGLSVVGQTRNDVVDTADWFRSHQLEEPSLAPDQAAADVPRSYRDAPLAAVLRTPDTEFLLYGAEFEPTLLVAVTADPRRVAYAFDFAQFTRAPEVAENEQDYVTQAIRWAQQVGDVLYVSTAHRTYAASSGGMNAYLTAIDVGTGALLWRSAPLVANADTFEVVDDRIVAGYGFTAEPDRLYLLDRGTGAVTGGIPLASGPEYIRRQGDQVLVRCYDTDYVVALGP